jgi:3-hydroxybutyryl-CoA dehydrogenase
MDIKKICVLGAGTMGWQIAQISAQKGFSVSMMDIEDRIVQSGLDNIKKSLKRYFIDKGKISQDEADKILSRIEGTTVIKNAVKGAQLVIEAIPEDLRLKQGVFKELDEICDKNTILASNTSAIRIESICLPIKRHDKAIGMHFFNPVAVMRIVEVVLHPKTSDLTYEIVKSFINILGKEIVLTNDSAGFISSRLLSVLTNEAAKLVYEGKASPVDIDKACEMGLGHAMGPLKTLDMANGIGIAVEVLEYLHRELGDVYKPCELFRIMASRGELGKSYGKGFYKY